MPAERYNPGFVSLIPPVPAPGAVDRAAEVRCSWADLREAVRARFYPAIVSTSEDGQARVDRAADTLVSLVMDTPLVLDVDAAWSAATTQGGEHP